MTEWDKQVVKHLNNLIKLDQAGKLKHLSHKEVSENIDKIIKAAQDRENAVYIKTYQNQFGYAI